MWGIAAPGDAENVREWLRLNPGARSLSGEGAEAGIVISKDCGHAESANGSYLCYYGTILGYPRAERPLTANALASALLTDYAKQGIRAFADLIGLAAIAVWDNTTRSLHLVRHPGGVPAIFYRRVGDSVVWSTRMDTLIRPTDRVDSVSVARFLRRGSLFTPATIVKGIKRVGPGEHVSISREGVEGGSVWTPTWGPRDISPTIHEKTSQLEDLMRSSLQQWLATSSKTPAILMSGGIDSAGLAAALTRLNRSDLTAYTVTFDQYSGPDDEFDEAHRVAEHLGIEHRSLRYGPRFIEDYIDWMAAWFFEPFSYALHTAQLAEIADSGHDLVLAGTGPDWWYPYDSEVQWRALTRLVPHSLLPSAKRLTGPLAHLPKMKGIQAAFHYAGSPLTGVIAGAMGGPPTKTDVLLALVGDEAALREEAATLGYIEDGVSHLPESDEITVRAYFSTLTTGPEAVTQWMQRWCEAYGLRPALPFLDPRIPGYVVRLANLMRDRGEFRELALRSLPRDLAYNRKIGQTVPLRSWFRGPLRGFLIERLADVSGLDGILDQVVVDTLVEDHIEGRADNRWLLWKLVSLTTWQRRFDELRLARRPNSERVQGPE